MNFQAVDFDKILGSFVRKFGYIALGYRLINALLNRTPFHPDEYYKSVELAHSMVFGYVYFAFFKLFSLTFRINERIQLRVKS